MRGGIRIAVAALGLLTLLNGCAKFPTNGIASSTKVTFTVTMNGPINPQTSIFAVLLYLSPSVTPPLPPSQEPSPAVSLGSINGIGTGFVTNCVLMDPTQSARPYAIYFFSSSGVDFGGMAIGSPTGFTNDQLASLDANGLLPPVWSFTVFIPQLQPSSASQYKSLTYQIIAMNKLALGNLSGRYMDAIGSAPNFAAQSARIDFSNTQSKTSLGLGGASPDTYPSGGDPGLAISDWTVQVTVP